MPAVSERQERAMYAAAEGNSTLGIPQSVGKEFIGKDMAPNDWRGFLRGLFKFLTEEMQEPEHQADDAKLSKEEVGLEHPAKGDNHCSQCEHYLGGACAIVKGEIAPEDWCKKFEAAAVTQDAGIALDRDSLREYDKDGRLHVKLSNISKAAVNPYLGKEIPGYQTLGLDPDKVYRLLRDPKELEKAAHTFNGLPLLIKHKPTTADDHQADLTVGSLGNDAVYEHPYLRNSLVIWPREAIEGIEDESQKELSAGYRYTPDMTPGEYEGEPYDGVMRNIIGNHIALVEDGRAGDDVVVGDAANPLIQEHVQMKLSRTASVAKGALLAFLAPQLAQDAKLDLRPMVADLTAKNYRDKKPALLAALTKAVKPKLAQDASVDGLAKVLDMIEGEVEGAEKEGEDDLPEASTEANAGTPAAAKEGIDEDDDVAKIMAHLKEHHPEAHDSVMKMMHAHDEPAKFEGEPKVEGEEKVDKHAMDEAIKTASEETAKRIRAEQKAIRDAERAVRPYVGELAIACDSAAEVYRAALKTLGVKNVDGIHESALPTILEMQTPMSKRKEPVIAADSASDMADFNKRFPDAGRIRKAS